MNVETAQTAPYHLWTAWVDYFATGEGRTILGLICYASSADDVRRRFGELFDPYFASGCDIESGVVRNAVTEFLWSDAALTALLQLDRRASVEATSRIHFNMS